MKVLPYWGGKEERKTLRRFFNPLNLYTENAAFHVCITSYQFMVQDQKVFNRITWQYMILDEAHSIKNVNSIRWNTLLEFSCRNRLLLTGTPIQNSMSELWALLHFIMPNLFDSHEQFQEWFSKDIEAHSQEKGELNEEQLKRLHKILKPFMLRRIKKDVENEIGNKTEYEISCTMTTRQQILYNSIKSKLNSISDLFSSVDSKVKVKNLMNLVMQFRKVCNHPELFERHLGKNPLFFSNLITKNYSDSSYIVPSNSGNNDEPIFLNFNLNNAMEFRIPKLLYDELYMEKQKSFKEDLFFSQNNSQIFNQNNHSINIKYSRNSNASIPKLNCKFVSSITSKRFILIKNDEINLFDSFQILNLLGFTEGQFKKIIGMNDFVSLICLKHFFERTKNTNNYYSEYISKENIARKKYNNEKYPTLNLFYGIVNESFFIKDKRLDIFYNDNKNIKEESKLNLPIFCENLKEMNFSNNTIYMFNVSYFFILFRLINFTFL